MVLREFLAFFRKQLANSIFALVIFAGLWISPIVPLPRYDFMLILCLGMQWWMVRRGLESREDLKLITVFHLLGLGLELYKVNTGSWSYPEESYTKFFGVPLYSGFMYAAVASYILQAWRNFDLSFVGMPSRFWAWVSVGLIYGNLLLSRVLGDWRWLVIGILIFVFGRSVVHFTCDRRRLQMPFSVALVLIGFFIWVAENICTYLGAWVYPHQESVWSPVHASKIVSWTLMAIVAFVCVWRWQVQQAAKHDARTSQELPRNLTGTISHARAL